MKVFIVDDTAIYRKILSDAVSSIEGLELVGTASRGALALNKLETLNADLILLDIFMPDMDGLETLQAIKSRFPDTHVVMVSGATTRDASITIKALRYGAADFIAKPMSPSFEEGMPIIIDEICRVARALGLKPRRSASPFAPEMTKTDPVILRRGAPPKHIELLLIGVSTGGPKALSTIVPQLPSSLSCPILIVQHMPATFTASLAEHLNSESALEVKEAENGEKLRTGCVYIAPGGQHMVVKRGGPEEALKIELNMDEPVNSCRPSVDVLFQSAARVVSSPVLAVVLTGMGEDGLRGVEALKAGTCYCITQSKDSCVVYGMPHAVVSNGFSDESVPLNRIADRIAEIVI